MLHASAPHKRNSLLEAATFVVLMTFAAIFVHRADADVTCSAAQNLVFEDCFSGCEASCNNTAPMCAMVCQQGGGCRCADGYVRASSAPNAACVPKQQCNCHANEVWAKCNWGKCQPTCAQPDMTQCRRMLGVGLECPPDTDTGSCLCKDGFIRDASNACVPKKACDCKTNEVFTDCTWSMCQPSCAAPDQSKCEQMAGIGPECIPNTGTGSCLCQSGYTRDDSSANNCIPKSQCPSSTTPN